MARSADSKAWILRESLHKGIAYRLTGFGDVESSNGAACNLAGPAFSIALGRENIRGDGEKGDLVDLVAVTI